MKKDLDATEKQYIQSHHRGIETVGQVGGWAGAAAFNRTIEELKPAFYIETGALAAHSIAP